jgi:hypothetical protein
MNTVRNLTSYSFETHFNILSSTSRSHKVSSLQVFQKWSDGRGNTRSSVFFVSTVLFVRYEIMQRE